VAPGNGNRSNQESKFDFLATHPTHQCLEKIDGRTTKNKNQKTLQKGEWERCTMPWQKAMLRDYRAMQPLAQVLRHIQGIPLGLQQQMLIYNEVVSRFMHYILIDEQ